MVASMMRLARAPLEGWLEWFIRTRVRAREFLSQEAFPRWSNRYYRDFFRLAYRINSKPNSLACKAHLWKYLQWWEDIRPEANNHRKHVSRHPRRFVPRRWENR
eukprot:7727618-Heterocapsa_arctica.AAC.1